MVFVGLREGVLLTGCRPSLTCIPGLDFLCVLRVRMSRCVGSISEAFPQSSISIRHLDVRLGGGEWFPSAQQRLSSQVTPPANTGLGLVRPMRGSLLDIYRLVSIFKQALHTVVQNLKDTEKLTRKVCLLPSWQPLLPGVILFLLLRHICVLLFIINIPHMLCVGS